VRERERESEMRMMRGGERVKEFLRPFVDSRTWDLCVIWKLGLLNGWDAAAVVVILIRI
jgi:hypothetical protein